MVDISCKDICYRIDDKDILRNVSLESSVARLGVVGRNGCGKTSLLRILAGLAVPDSGRLSIGNIDPAKDRQGALATVGILFQNPEHQILFPTVIEEISFGLRQMGNNPRQADDQAMQILTEFGLSHWRDVAIYSLSGGQQHLLCLMAILVMQPKVVMLDEPFVGLDISTKMQLLKYLKKINTTIIHITHQPDDLVNYDEIVWLEAGQVRMKGNPQTVLPEYVSAMEQIGQGNDLANLAS